MDLTVIALGLRNALLVQSLFDRLRALLAGRSEPALDGLQQALAPASTLRLPLGLPPGAGAIVLDITESILRETKPENLEQDTGGSLVWVGNTSWGDEIHAVIAEAATNDLRLRHRCRVELSSRAAELTKSLGVPDLVSLDDQVLDSLIGPTLRFEDGPAISAQLGERIGRWRARVGQL